jgi:HAE1 family hydrophobic/amphiphilic exporter-1
MRLPELSARHPIATLMVFLGLVFFGLISLGRLGLELFPDISFPTVAIATAHAGVAPQEIELSITEKIEDAVATLNGVEEIRSTSGEGISLVIVHLSWGTNMDTILFEVREKVNAVEKDLPEGAERPRIIRFNPEFLPTIQFNVSSHTAGLDLRELARREIVPELEKIRGVAAVDLFGGRQAAVLCRLDLDAAAKMGVSLLQLIRVFEAENVNLPAGSISLEDRHLLLRTVGEFSSLEDIENVRVGHREGGPVYLRDVASVRMDFLPGEEYFRSEGAEGVQVAVRKQPGYNTVEINREVRRRVEELRRGLPPSVGVRVQQDQSRQILNSIGGLSDAAWQGGLLAVAVLLLFLRNVPSTLIISLAIPLSVVATFAMMYFGGIRLNMVSLMGLTLGVGMFVDNSIVMLEASYRKQLAGLAPLAAAVEGTREVANAITASTLTTVAVFLPLFFVQGIAGLIFRDLAYTISFALFISLFMALSLMPVLCSRFLRTAPWAATGGAGAGPLPPWPAAGGGGGAEAAGFRMAAGASRDTGEVPAGGMPDARLLDTHRGPQEADRLEPSLADLAIRTGFPPVDWTGEWIRRGLAALDAAYERAIRWALEHSAAVVGTALSLFLLSIATVVLLGTEFLPMTDEGAFSVGLETRIGTPYERTLEKVLQAEEILRQIAGPDLSGLSSSIGRGGKLSGAAETGSHLALIDVALTDKDDRTRTIWQIAEEVRRRLAREILDVRIRVDIEGMAALATSTTGESEPLVIELSGDDLDRLHGYGRRIAGAARGVAGARDIDLSYKSGKPELELRVRRREAASLGFSPLEIAATLRTAFKGTTVSTYRSEGRDYDVVVLLRDEDRSSLDSLTRLALINPAGQRIPLENVVERVAAGGPLSIERQNRTRMVKVTGALTGDRPLNRVVEELRQRIEKLGPVPPGVRMRFTGSVKQMQEAFRSLFFVLAVAVVLVYMVMAAQFESLLHPLIVMFSVPFSVIGMVALLLLTGTSFNIMAFVGGILLVGIVVNNAIVLVDYTNLLRRRGLSLTAAVVRGGKTRLKPILMTSLTTIFGLVPMALGVGMGSELRAPLGRAVLGGLATSTLVTLILIPTLYVLVERRRESRSRRAGKDAR